MSYQQAFPKYAQLQALAVTTSMRQECEVNPPLKKIGFADKVFNTLRTLWEYDRDAIWESFKNNWTFELSGGFGAGIEPEFGLLQINIAEVLYGGSITYNSTDGWTNTVKALDTNIELSILESLFAFGTEVDFEAPQNEVSEYGLIYSPSRQWSGWGGLRIAGITFGPSTDNINSDLQFSYGGSSYFIVGGGYSVSFNITKFFRDLESVGII